MIATAAAEHGITMSNGTAINDSRRLQAIYAVHTVLNQMESSNLDIQALLGRIIDVAVNQIGANEGTLIIVNQNLEIEYAWLVNQAAPPSLLNKIIDDGLAGQVIRSQKPVIIHDTCSDPRWLTNVDNVTSHTPWSIICVPVINRGYTTGVVTLHKAGIGQFTPTDVDLLTTITNQVANSIENARLYQQSQRQLKVSALLQEASQIINSTLNIDEVMQRLLSQMNNLLNAEAISIALVDQQANELVYRTAHGPGSEKIEGLRMPSNQGLSGWVMNNKEAILVSDAASDPRFNPEGDRRTGYQTQAMICAPMIFKRQVLGTIQAVNPSKGPFTQRDLTLLVNLANIASSALANAQQYAQTVAAETRYMNLFQDSIDPILLSDTNGQIVEANQQATTFFGYGREELVGRIIDTLYVEGNDRPQMSAVADNKAKQFTGQVLTKQGVTIPIEVYAKRMQFGRHGLLQWIYRDISEQLELEQMREDLIAMLFHDLQSPLGNVISSLALMKDELPQDSDPALHLMLDIAARSSSRLQTLVRSLLDITQLEAGHPINDRREVDLNQLVQDVWEYEEPNFDRRSVSFHREIDRDVPLIYVEEDMIRRVLVNLISNALKYSSEGDFITVSARHGWENDNAKILVSVADQGQGIPPQYRMSIFDKFQRIASAKSSSAGLGLGLAFCRLAVEAHGGKIWVDDAPGGGARFNLTLPVAYEMLACPE